MKSGKSTADERRAASTGAVRQPPPHHPNRLLATLLPDDFALLAGDLKPEILERRKSIERRDTRIERVYFVNHGIISVVAIAGQSEIEIGLIGCEGVSGIPVIHGDDRSPHSTYVQVEGSGLSIAADSFRKAIEQSKTLRQTLLRYAQAFLIQTNHTANAKAKVEERLARWILMAHDRVPAKNVSLTHEFLAIMLGVRRPGVTTAIHQLAKRGLIENPKSGILTVCDRAGLEKFAGRFYGVPEKEYKRLIG